MNEPRRRMKTPGLYRCSNGIDHVGVDVQILERLRFAVNAVPIRTDVFEARYVPGFPSRFPR